MMTIRGSIAVAVAVCISSATLASAGFSASSVDNVAIYWGQNSYQQTTNPYTQQRLAYYCANTSMDVIPLAFLDAISIPSVNFANAGNNCTTFSGSSLLSCPQIEADIETCQSTYGKTILLSVGGSTYTEGGFSSAEAAVAAADTIWAMFGPVQSSSDVNRPFGDAVVDGFDFDFESSTSNMAPFAQELRAKMDTATAAGGKHYYLSAAPQCPYPDVADNDMLSGDVYFDFIMIQFYNNYCGLQSFDVGASAQNNFNFGTWDDWAQTVSNNSDVRIFLGIPGSATAAGSGYTSGSTLASIVSYAKQYDSFGGIMIWDMSQVYANTGFLGQVVADLASGTSTSAATSKSPSASPETTSTSTASSTTRPISTTLATPKTTKPTYATSTAQLTASPTAPLTISPTTLPTTSRTTTSRMTLVTSPTSPSTSISTKKTTNACSPSGVTSTVTVTVTVTAGATTTFATKITSASAVSTGVAQWGQCGGIGYTGPTTCAPPYSCSVWSVWWSQCE